MNTATQARTQAVPKKINWANTLFFGGLTIGALVLPPIYVYFAGFSWQLLALLVVGIAVSNMGITAGYHRCFSHRAFEASPLLKWWLLLTGASAFEGSALEWCTDHRQHHRNVDTPKDPYNINEGFFHAHIGWILFHSEDHEYKFPRDLAEDPALQWQHKNYIPLAIFFSFVLPTGVGALMGMPVGGLVFGGILRQFFVSHSTFLINSWAHTFGNRPYDQTQTARNSMVLAVLTFGEGYHNYHHRFASDYRNGIRWYQWDPTKWLIRTYQGLGLARKLKVIPQTEILRAELSCEQEALLCLGVPAEQITDIRIRVEQAARRARLMRQEYLNFKAQWNREYRQKLQEVRAQGAATWESVQEEYQAHRLMRKAEWKRARLEFKAAATEWGYAIRAWRAHPQLAVEPRRNR